MFLASAELAAVTAIEGRLPTVEQYRKYADQIQASAQDTFRYLNFDRMPDFAARAGEVGLGEDYRAAVLKETERLKAQQ